MKIIALFGPQNVGKSATLLELINVISNSGGSVAVPTFNPSWGTLLNYNGQLIGITTDGDSGQILQNNCKFFINNKCDIMITATRTRGATVDEVFSLSKTLPAELIWAAKSYYANNTTIKATPAQINTMNNLEANFLFSLI